MSYTHERTARRFIGTAPGKIPQAAPRGGSKRKTFGGNHLGAKFLSLPLAAPQASSKAHARGDATRQSCLARARSERASSAIDRVQFTPFSVVFLKCHSCTWRATRALGKNEAVLESLRSSIGILPRNEGNVRYQHTPSTRSRQLRRYRTEKYLPGTPQRNNAEQSSKATATPQQSLVAHHARAAALRHGREASGSAPTVAEIPQHNTKKCYHRAETITTRVRRGHGRALTV